MRESYNFDIHGMCIEADRLIAARKETSGRTTIPLYNKENDDIDGRLKITIKIKMMKMGYSYHWKIGFYKSQYPTIVERPHYRSGYPEVF